MQGQNFLETLYLYGSPHDYNRSIYHLFLTVNSNDGGAFSLLLLIETSHLNTQMMDLNPAAYPANL